eukprot:2038537-Pleurochrysis_carterae.AAC.1
MHRSYGEACCSTLKFLLEQIPLEFKAPVHRHTLRKRPPALEPTHSNPRTRTHALEPTHAKPRT